MTLKFYNISDDRRCLVKTLNNSGSGKNLTATLSGHVKRDCSIIDPIFEVSYDSDLMTSNYIYCPELSRYYFINNITVSTQRLLINAHVDVLMSYRNGIDNLVCVIARQEKEGRSNLYLNDGMWRNLQPKESLTISRGYSSFDDTGSYILAVGGKS